ncbi:MAG TPA: MFS transporter [Gemmatimonadaceae bacterium]|nr:MFS transporter [Gemmatimonadaceae bacterium]
MSQPESTAAAPPQHSTRYAWYVMGVLTLANVGGFVDRQILSLLVVPIRRDLAISDTQVSLLMGLAFSVFYTVLGLPLGWLADRASRKAIMGWGVAIWSVMTAACGLAGSFGRLLTTRIGVGVGEATLVPAATSFIPDYFPPERLGTAMSVFSLGIFLGSGLAYVIGGAMVGLLEAHGQVIVPLVGAVRPWQLVFFAVGLPGLVVSLLFFTVREPPRKRDAHGASTAELFAYVRRHGRSFACTSLGFSFSAMVNYGIAGWLATFLIRTYGWTATRAGAVQGALTMTVGVAGVLAGGRVADWYVRRGHTDGPLRVGVIGAVGMLVSATAYPLMPTAGLCVAWLVVVNFFAAFPWGAIGASAAEIVPARMRAQGSALYFLVLSLVSSTLGPTLVALITDHVFHADAALRYSLAIANVAGMSAAIVVLLYGMPAYRTTIATRDD